MSQRKLFNALMDILAFVTPFLGLAVEDYTKKMDREEIARQVAERLLTERKLRDVLDSKKSEEK